MNNHELFVNSFQWKIQDPKFCTMCTGKVYTNAMHAKPSFVLQISNIKGMETFTPLLELNTTTNLYGIESDTDTNS